MPSYAHDISIIQFVPPDLFKPPQKGTTLVEEMACYSLPYGGLGFASHILTYYTVIVLSTGRSPIRPWKELSHARYDLFLSTVGLVGGSAIAVFTLVRCRNHWQLLLIGIWKLSMSVFNGIVGVHISTIMKNAPKPPKKRRNKNASSSSYLPLVDRSAPMDDDDTASQRSGTTGAGSFVGSSHKPITRKVEGKIKKPKTGTVWLWAFLYVPGMIAGFVGLISLIIHNWGAHPKLHIITYVFAGVFGFIILLSTFTFFLGIGEGLAATFGVTLITFAALAALYGDWALGAMTNNLWGFPSQDSFGLYVSYLILKRFTMFSL